MYGNAHKKRVEKTNLVEWIDWELRQQHVGRSKEQRSEKFMEKIMKTDLEIHAVDGGSAEGQGSAYDGLNSEFQKYAGDAVNAIAAAEEVIALATAIAKKALDISLMHQSSSIELILQAAKATLATTEVAVQKTLMEAKESAVKTLVLARTMAGEPPTSTKKTPIRSRQRRVQR